MEHYQKVVVFKDLATHVKETGWGVFDENVIRRIVERDFPGSLDIPTKDDLVDFFGVDYLKVNKLKPKCGIKRYNYLFKVRNLEALRKKIDERTEEEIVKDCRETWKETHRVDKRVIENVYNFINFMPCSNTEYTRETGKLAPSDADLMRCINMCPTLDAEIIVEKIGTSKVRRLESKNSTSEILEELNNTYNGFYKKDIQIFKKKESEPIVEPINEEKELEKEVTTEIVPNKEFPEMFLNRLRRDIDEDRDYNIAICILNMMKDAHKTSINITDVFCELKKFNIGTGLNFREWCGESKHFRNVSGTIQIKPESYCEMMFRKPLLSKKEETAVIPAVNVEKEQPIVKEKELESFYILTENNLSETDYLKFEKKVHGLNAYCCFVDFNDPVSIQAAYEFSLTIGQDNILGKKVIDKICETVLNAIKAYTSINE